MKGYSPQGIFLPPRTATLTIAAANSHPLVKAQADVVCPGVNDASIIQAVINDAVVGGVPKGEIYFHAGTYYPEVSIQIPENITIRGAGKQATHFQFSNGCHGFIKAAAGTTYAPNIVIRDLRITVDNAHYGIYGYGFWYAYFHRIRIDGALCGIWLSGNEGAGFVGAYENLIQHCHFYNCKTGIRFTGVVGDGQANSNVVRSGYFTIELLGGIPGSIGVDIDVGALIELDSLDIDGHETGIRVTDNGSGAVIIRPWVEANVTDIVSTVTTNIEPLIIAPRISGPLTITGRAVIQSGRAISRYNGDSQSVTLLENSDYTEGNGCPDPECEYIGSVWIPGNAGSVVAEEMSIVKRPGGKSLHVNGNTTSARAIAYIKNPWLYQGRANIIVSGWCYQPAGNPDPTKCTLQIYIVDGTTPHWFQIGTFSTSEVWTFVHAEINFSAYTDIRQMVMECNSNADDVARNNHAYFWGMRLSLGRQSVYYPQPSLRVHPTIRFSGCDHFQDVRAASAAYYGNAVALDAALPLNLWTTGAQPDVPRSITWNFVSHAQVTAFTINIIGVDAKGNSITVTKTQADGWSGETSQAFATITSIQMTARTGTGVGDMINIGTGSRLGLSKPIYSGGDVYKVTKNNADYPSASYTPGATWDTVNVSTGGAIVDGDDFTMWYKSTPVPVG